MSVQEAEGQIDQITLQVVNSYLITTAREMGIAMRNTSYSPLFNEGLDFSCAIFDDQGEMTAQAEFCPAHLGAIIYVVEWTIWEIGRENFQPGDVVFHNDPFRGGCHLPEYCVIKPVFFDGELVSFVACIGHMTEVGGKVPGGFAGDATEVFQEGIRIPPLKIVEGGKDIEAVWNIILANVRTPRMSYGDMKAMIGSLHVGEQRIMELLEKYSPARFRDITEAIKDYSERRMRAEISEMPDGEYRFEDDVIENDGITGEPSKLQVAVTIAGDHMTVDYTGSGPQRRGPVNCTYGVTASATYNALLHLTDHSIPSNHGCYRPVRIIAPPGTIVNVEYPGASVGGNSEIHPHLVMAIYGALASALPERVSAHDGGTSALVAVGGVHPETGDVFANLTNEGCGWGGRASKDGNNALCIPNGNCALQPIEILETRYPMLHEALAIEEGSAGAGRNRGGFGYRRQFRVMSEELRVSCFIEKEEIRPWGLFGGEPGKNSGILVSQDGGETFRTMTEAFGVKCNGKFSDVYLAKGDSLRIITSGGGGYGPALERSLDRIEEDVRQGFIPREQAESEYVVRFRADSVEIDVPATEALRRDGIAHRAAALSGELEGAVTDLDGKVGVVTGAGRGIGRAIASELGSAGCRLALCSRSDESVRYAEELVADGIDAVGASVDVSDIEAFQRFVADVVDREGSIDILVNNAGVNHSGAVASMSTEAFDEIFAVNVRGLFYAIQTVAPYMSERRSGKIVNIASVVARSPVPLYTAYSASKAAVLSLTRGLALELAAHNINVNAVCPANIWSDIWDSSTRELTALTGKTSQEFFEETVARQPFGRPQTGDEIGAAVVFLCSEGARDITGEAIFVTGGL